MRTDIAVIDPQQNCQLMEVKFIPFCWLQIVDVCEEYQKEAKLARLLEEIGCQQGSKIIIFVETKRKADELTR